MSCGFLGTHLVRLSGESDEYVDRLCVVFSLLLSFLLVVAVGSGLRRSLGFWYHEWFLFGLPHFCVAAGCFVIVSMGSGLFIFWSAGLRVVSVFMVLGLAEQ